MSRFQWKHYKTHKETIINGSCTEKIIKQSIETLQDKVKMLLINKDLKSASLNIFKQLKEIMSNKLMASMKMTTHQIYNAKKERKRN